LKNFKFKIKTISQGLEPWALAWILFATLFLLSYETFKEHEWNYLKMIIGKTVIHKFEISMFQPLNALKKQIPKTIFK